MTVLVVVLAFAGVGVKSCFFDGAEKGAATAEGKASKEKAKPVEEAVAYAEAAPAAPAAPAEDASYSDVAVQSAAMIALKEKLTDPGSAKFRRVTVHRQSSGTKVVCGEVNAKNRAGGYNGYVRFVSLGTTEYTYLEQEVEDMNSLWREVCR